MARQYKAPRLEKILNRSLLAQVNESTADLKSEYKFVRRVIQRREKAFGAAGLSDLFREPFSKGNIKGLRQLTDKKALVDELNRLEGFLRDPRSSIAGALRAQEIIEKRRQSLGETMGRELSSEEYANIGNFLGAMQKRVGEMWKDWSETSVKLFEEAQRLNLDPGQFLRNYQYWLDHAEDLEDVTPLNYANVKPSSYVRQLMKNYFNENPTGEFITPSGAVKRKK